MLSVCLLSFFLILLHLAIIMDGFWHSGCLYNCVDLLNMTGYLKVVPMPPLWQKWYWRINPYLNPFKELQSWNLKSKIITPKYIASTYFGTMAAIMDFLWFRSRPLKPAPTTCWHIVLYHMLMLSAHGTQFS